jgi:CRISPR-associated protein Cas1
MIKRTLYFGNPAYLGMKNAQLEVRLPQVEKNDTLPAPFKESLVSSIPIEDIGMVVIDHSQVTLTQGLISTLLENNAAIITCDNTHHPTGLLLPLDGNIVQNERFRHQLDASEPLKKQLWAQTIIQKIKNQAALLDLIIPLHEGDKGGGGKTLRRIASQVKSGDSNNCEATAAALFWQKIFSTIQLPSLTGEEQSERLNFVRYREGPPPNNYLNYGYAVLRAIMARSIVAAGLLPTLGIHHANRYNAYCLADDLMEPYRPFVDKIVHDLVAEHGINTDIPKEIKTALLKIPVIDVSINDETSPLMIATQRTAVSLVKCFNGEQKKLLYPNLSSS